MKRKRFIINVLSTIKIVIDQIGEKVRMYVLAVKFPAVIKTQSTIYTF